MNDSAENPTALPAAAALARAVRLFLDRAYPDGVPASAERLCPPADADLAAWLMGDPVERSPADAGLDQVRSFALRLGNAQYPHMKLRLGRVPRHEAWLFTVDSHDAILKAPPGSPDCEALEALKRHNAALASDILAALDTAGLPTERNFLRQKIRRAKQRNQS